MDCTSRNPTSSHGEDPGRKRALGLKGFAARVSFHLHIFKILFSNLHFCYLLLDSQLFLIIKEYIVFLIIKKSQIGMLTILIWLTAIGQPSINIYNENTYEV